MNHHQWEQHSAFINRQAELKFMKRWFEKKEPAQVLFFYGPKSSGKTTLIYKFKKEFLSDKKYVVKHFNLRALLITTYRDFLQTFFAEKETTEEERKLYAGLNLHAFKVGAETKEKIVKLQLNPFEVLTEELVKLNRKGKKPIIIIDELQALEGIYMNGQRELLIEMFNFFVSITKETHLCHVLLSNSDGFFVQQIYNDSKLSKTTELYEIDYLPKDDIYYWLNHLEKESGIKDFTLTQTQQDNIWTTFGGSVWEVNAFLGALSDRAENGQVAQTAFAEEKENRLQRETSYWHMYAKGKQKKELVSSLSKILTKKDSFTLSDLMKELTNIFSSEEELEEQLIYLVKQNLLYYNPEKVEYKTQGNSVYIGLKRYVNTTGN